MLTMDAKSESGNFFFRLQNSRMKRKRAEDNATVERRAKKVQVTYSWVYQLNEIVIYAFGKIIWFAQIIIFISLGTPYVSVSAVVWA
jgi:hypothetical protein